VFSLQVLINQTAGLLEAATATRCGKRRFRAHFQIKKRSMHREQLGTNIRKLLKKRGVTHRLPVFLGWDSQIFWGNRHDLWNHFNSSAPGFDPKNRENVEWTSWSPDDAVDVSWLNWGSQMRVPPAQNIHAPAIKAATAHALSVVSGVVAAWWRAATPADRGLLAGIKIGCEAGIGWQVWQYEGGNAIFKVRRKCLSFLRHL
jgi:hypothetical protein